MEVLLGGQTVVILDPDDKAVVDSPMLREQLAIAQLDDQCKKLIFRVRLPNGEIAHVPFVELVIRQEVGYRAERISRLSLLPSEPPPAAAPDAATTGTHPALRLSPVPVGPAPLPRAANDGQ